ESMRVRLSFISGGICVLAFMLWIGGAQATTQAKNVGAGYKQGARAIGSATPSCLPEWHTVQAPVTGTLGSTLMGVEAITQNDAWAVCSYVLNGSLYYDNATLIEHWNGMQWSVVESPNVQDNSNLLS